MGYYNGKIIKTEYYEYLEEIKPFFQRNLFPDYVWDHRHFLGGIDVTKRIYILTYSIRVGQGYSISSKGPSFLLDLGIKYNLIYGSHGTTTHIQLHIPKKDINTIVNLIKLKRGI